MTSQLIETIEQFQEIINKHDRFLFVKNSLTCPISQAAFEEFQEYVKKYSEVPAYYLHVQDSRQLSNYIADTYSVKHESPQALLFENKKVIWNTSHWNITSETLQKEVAK